MLGQRQLEGDGEGAGGRAQRFGKQQAAAVRVEAAGPLDHDLVRQGAHRQAVAGLQPRPRAQFEGLARRFRLQRGGQGLAGGVEFGEVVALRLDILPHPVGGGLVPRARRVGLCPVAGAAVGEGAIEAQEGVGGGRLVLGQLDDLVARHGQALEHRIGEGLGQGRLGGRAAGGAEAAQVDVVGLGQPQQQLGRDGALVALDVVQIAGRTAEVGGHRRLGQAQIAPQPLEAAAQEQLAVGGLHWRRVSQNDLTSSVMM